MKAFAACALALVPEMLAAPLRRPIILALSRDEEIGCLGAPELIEALLATLPRPARTAPPRTPPPRGRAASSRPTPRCTPG
jgi:hypothetical protein